MFVNSKSKRAWLSFLAIGAALVCAGTGAAGPITVRYKEGVIHGFLTMRTTDGERIANGDLNQTVRGDRITAELTFHFKDGSLYQETTVFYQNIYFRLVSDHLIQKGPSFKQPLEMSIDTTSREVTVRYTDDHGKEKSATQRMELPADLANGMLFTVLKDIQPNAVQTAASMVVAGPKPRVVKLTITPSGEEPFSVGDRQKKAARFDVHIQMGGVAGAAAKVIGKHPPDLHIWIYRDKAPLFLKMDGPLFEEGPIWRIELAGPTWPGEQPSH